jgi:PKD repeat protein
MRKVILFSILLLTASQPIQERLSSRDVYKEFLAEHPFNSRPRLSPEQWKSVPKQDRPDLAWEQNYLATMDPMLGRPARERLDIAYQIVDQNNSQVSPTVPGSASSPWVERGPNNVGGRTRAIMWDPNAVSGNKVWAGGAGGGLWYNNNITSSTSAWIPVGDLWDNLAITSISYDPNNNQIFYVGTGEGWGAGASRGAGIWKSINGGTTWTQLTSTISYHYVNDLVVRNEGGTSAIYAACRRNFYRGQWHGVNGLYRSINGGSSWTQVLPNIPGQSSPYAAADIELAADNRIWIGTQETSQSLSNRGGGRVLYSDNGTTWTLSYTVSNGERVELACAPSNSSYVYALTEISGQAGEIARTTNKGSTWSTRNEPVDADNGIPNTDFTRGQAWYDLIMAVDPNNANTLIAGGIDLFRSTNGASSWSQISKWSNNNNLSALNCSYVHADQHQIVFKPASSSTVLFGGDGGVFYTNSLASAATSNVISARNKDYNVTQFYAAAIHPSAGSHYALAGAQDNGTQKFSLPGFTNTTQATGGDGAFCFIDQTNANYQITSYVYNNFWRSTNAGSSWGSRFQNDNTTGRFINPAEYDDNQGILYSARTTSTVNRVSGIRSSPSISSISISGMSSMASHLRVSPYTTTSTTLFVGTEGGDLYRVSNANSTPTTTNIGSSSFPSGNVSCVELGANNNELLVTFSNYGVNSIWYSSNGGTSWQSKEGNLPDIPVRWALFNPNNRSEVILATEVGVWSTSNFTSSSPSWSSSNSGLARVRVDMLQIRDSDKEVIAATHGRGLFTSSAFGVPQLPIAEFGISPAAACLSDTILLSDSSTGSPSSWLWTISPSTYNFVNGTNANSQNVALTFSASGSYSFTLIASNANGSDTITKTNVLQVGGLSLPFIEDFEGTSSLFTVENPDNGITWSLNTIGGTSPGNMAAGVNFFSYNSAGERDGLISPPLNFSNYSSVNLDFDYSYARYSASFRDSMAIFVSTNCGQSYQRVASYTSDVTGNFATVSDNTSSFSPSAASDWCGNAIITSCPTVNLDAFAGQSEVRIKFEAINGYGNNLYLDNINVSGVQSINTPQADFSANDSTICAASSITFTDLSTNSPTSWAWSISPSGYTYVAGSSSSSQNPQVQFNTAGNYTISLVATNSFGSNTETKAAFIQVDASINPSVQITANANSWCAGQNAIFTATSTAGGTSPSYQWKLNGLNVGTNSNSFSSVGLTQGDIISLALTSNDPCALNPVTTSNSISIVINAPVVPTITISTAATTLCAGSNANFSASVNGGGSNPSYQWKLNGTNIGTNSSVYSSASLANNDQVSVEVIGNGACASASAGVSNTISMNIRSLPIISTMSPPFAPLCITDSLILSATVNNHGIPGTLTSWSGTGVQNGVFYASIAGAGTHNLSIGYLYASQPNCPVNASIQVSVDALSIPSFTRSGLILTCNQPGVNYLWLLNGSPAPGTNNQQTYALQVNGIYSVEVSNNICSLESSTSDIIDLSLETLKSEWQWQVYPNPAQNDINIGFQNPGVAAIQISLFDARGALLYSSNRKVNGGEVQESISIGNFSSGIYHLQVKIGDLVFHEQVIKD